MVLEKTHDLTLLNDNTNDITIDNIIKDLAKILLEYLVTRKYKNTEFKPYKLGSAVNPGEPRPAVCPTR